MAHPPPTKPAAAPVVDQAALDEVAVQRLEGDIDAWIHGQSPLRGLSSPTPLEVSIGERDSIRPEVQALLCKRYLAAGWSKATTAQDIEGEEIHGPDGAVLGKTAARPDPRGIVLTLVP